MFTYNVTSEFLQTGGYCSFKTLCVIDLCYDWLIFQPITVCLHTTSLFGFKRQYDAFTFGLGSL